MERISLLDGMPVRSPVPGSTGDQAMGHLGVSGDLDHFERMLNELEQDDETSLLASKLD